MVFKNKKVELWITLKAAITIKKQMKTSINSRLNSSQAKSKRGIFKAITALLILTLVFGGIGVAKADELTDQINNKKQELSGMSGRINELRDSIVSKQKELASLSNQMQIMDSQVELIQLQIRSTELEIEKTNAEIQKTEEEITQKEIEIENKKKSIGNVVKKLYIEKDNNILSIIVDSASFSDMIVNSEYLARIRISLKEEMEKLKTLKAELEKQKEDLDKKVESLDQMKNNKKTEETALEDQRSAKAQILAVTKGQESEYQNQLNQARAEEQAISSEIIQLVQEQARRQRAAEGVAGRAGRETPVSKGDFVSPLAGGMRISITGGDFMDPAYGMGFPHTGVDLSAGQGTPVISIGVGSVIIARDSGGAGLSYIAINHGNGVISKYLHMSAIYVSQGDIINAGEVIGATGGTPGSRGAGIFTTGAHLHFELNDYNGNALNPHNYFNIASPLF